MTRSQPARFSRIAATLLATILVLAAAAAVSAIAKEPTALRGHVLLPDGQPATGAELYLIQFRPALAEMPDELAFEKRAAADNQGRFEFAFAEQDTPLENMTRSLIAYLPGYGIDWLEVASDQMPEEAVLRLVADNPIRGRVIDTEGRPAAGAKIAVKIIADSPSGNLDGFLAGKEKPVGALNRERQLLAVRWLLRFETVTDREGRFELSGVGAERLAAVNISAPGLASENLEIVNRDGFDGAQHDKAIQAGVLPRRYSRLIGPVFEHVAEAELMIRGAVFTGMDHEPVAGARVSSHSPFVQTDELGRFELRGLRRGAKAMFYVYSPRTSDFLARTVTLDLAPGQTAVETEVELNKGVVVEGRVFDQATMRGVRSAVAYHTLPDNGYVDQPEYDGFVPTFYTNDDGRFRVVVPPGQAVLMSQLQMWRPPYMGTTPAPYRQATISEEDAKSVQIVVRDGLRYVVANMGRRQALLALSVQNAVKFLNPPPGSGPVACDLLLETGKTIKLAIEDEQGQRVGGAFVSGTADSLKRTFRIAESNCDIVGLGADRPRRVAVLHPERHLAGSVTLTGDEPPEVTLRLSATASMTGRVLDADGGPLADAQVQIRYDHGAVLYDDEWAIKTDGDGQFHDDNVLPDEPFEIHFIKGGKFFRVPRITGEKRQLKPREQLELGELKAKETQ
ncbi:MAG TPA: hypothetical protein VFI31_21175 [Pirellulales bacterium]|nr:hypothetical protein [Pirellulales bacterium]